MEKRVSGSSGLPLLEVQEKDYDEIFTKQITKEEAEDKNLIIPEEIATRHFGKVNLEDEFNIDIGVIGDNKTWYLVLKRADYSETCFIEESSNVHPFATWNAIKKGDTLLLYERNNNTTYPIDTLPSYAVQVQKLVEQTTAPQSGIRGEDRYRFLFKKELENPLANRLLVPLPEMNKHFLVVNDSKEAINLRVCDLNHETIIWEWELNYVQRSWLIRKRWRAYLNTHKLEAGDFVRFYKLIDESLELPLYAIRFWKFIRTGGTSAESKNNSKESEAKKRHGLNYGSSSGTGPSKKHKRNTGVDKQF